MGSPSAGLARAAAAALLALGCATAEPRALPVLHAVPTRAEPGFDARAPVVAVGAANPQLLAGALPADSVVAVTETEVIVRLAPYPVLSGAPDAAHLASTFLVDHDSDAVRALVAERGDDARPSPDDLVQWMRDAITPTYDRGFDAASVVARNRRGDCTEFAVLYGALARHFGHPARIAVGIVLAELDGDVQSFGHAWVEVADDVEGWRRVDPTPLDDVRVLGYLPTGHIQDEGPGYAFDLVRAQAAGVRDVRVLRDAASAMDTENAR